MRIAEAFTQGKTTMQCRSQGKLVEIVVFPILELKTSSILNRTFTLPELIPDMCKFMHSNQGSLLLLKRLSDEMLSSFLDAPISLLVKK